MTVKVPNDLFSKINLYLTLIKIQIFGNPLLEPFLMVKSIFIKSNFIAISQGKSPQKLTSNEVTVVV